MLFSSNAFLFLFLPALCILYNLLRKSRKWQNAALTLASLFFYAWGEPAFVLVMLLSIVVNWYLGLKIGRDAQDDAKKKKTLLVLAVVFNLSLLFVFKYLNFTLENLNRISFVHLPQTHIALPIGISFFTFQAMSYVIDVYRGKGKAQTNIINIALYISLFPQLIAGPIVRYETIADQIENRKETIDGFCSGLSRFVVGLSKKVLLANNLALAADMAFDGSERSVATAWLGALAYTLQIYYDFGGYSDMAIGLGEMFGFKFLENFNYPYVSRSVSEFWRRWHISLGTWFRDYVYFPLGGSRVDTKLRLARNLFIVWLLTGVWHGAQWTFLFWGLMYFVLLLFEKLSGFERREKKIVPLRYLYTMFFVVAGWVLFRAPTLGGAVQYYASMLGFGANGLTDGTTVQMLMPNLVFFIAGVLFAFPVVPKLKEKLSRFGVPVEIVRTAVLICLLVFDLSAIVIGSYNPFIYFNF